MFLTSASIIATRIGLELLEANEMKECDDSSLAEKIALAANSGILVVIDVNYTAVRFPLRPKNVAS